ncbi:MAG TPA: hypothetical protein VL985_09840, partial [Stellaceae bacterium]|nr:hypothetical protein [Stellaceae bacterium]
GKQIQDAVGIWGSAAIHHDGKQSIDLALSLEAAGCRTLEALGMPELATRPLRPGFCCFPGFAERGGEAKNGPEGPF